MWIEPDPADADGAVLWKPASEATDDVLDSTSDVGSRLAADR